MSNKVLITGFGAVSPLGNTAEDSFQAAVNGVNGIARPETFDADLTEIYAAGEVKNFDPAPYVNKREARRMAKFAQFALVSALQAWEQSGWNARNTPSQARSSGASSSRFAPW